MNLEGRTCKLKGCPNKFKVTQVSAQHYCSSYHATEDGCEPPEIKKNVMLWTSRRKREMAEYYTGTREAGDQKRASSEGARPVSKEIGIGTIMTQNTVNERVSYKKPGGEKILKPPDLEKEPVIVETKTKKMQKNERPGPNILIPTIENKGRVMQETENNDLKQSKQEKNGETLPTVLPRPLMITDVVSSPSLNLIDDTAEHLFSVMKEQKKGENHTIPEAAMVIECAKGIKELLKLKVDALRVVQLK